MNQLWLHIFTLNKALLFLVVALLFSFTFTTSLYIFPFRSSLDRYSKVKLFSIWLHIIFLTVSNAVVLQCILRLFLFSNFTTSISCLHDLIFLVKSIVWFNTKLLCLVCIFHSGCTSCSLVASFFHSHINIQLVRQTLLLLIFACLTDSSCFLSLPSYCYRTCCRLSSLTCFLSLLFVSSPICLSHLYDLTLPLTVFSYFQLLLSQCLGQLAVFLGLQVVPTNQYFVVMQAGQCFYHPLNLRICDLDDILVTSLALAFTTFSILSNTQLSTLNKKNTVYL